VALIKGWTIPEDIKLWGYKREKHLKPEHFQYVVVSRKHFQNP